MRIIGFILIFLLTNFSFAHTTLFQARGLAKGKCYEEPASLICQKDKCVLDLFPTTQAQISLHVKEISQKDRMQMGRLFIASFQVVNDQANQIKILSLAKVSEKQFISRIRASSGIVVARKCRGK